MKTFTLPLWLFHIKFILNRNIFCFEWKDLFHGWMKDIQLIIDVVSQVTSTTHHCSTWMMQLLEKIYHECETCVWLLNLTPNTNCDFQIFFFVFFCIFLNNYYKHFYEHRQRIKNIDGKCKALQQSFVS